MRKTILSAAASLLLSCSAAIWAAPGAPWRIREVSGAVSLVEGNNGGPAAPGTVMQPGTRLATGVDGRAVIERGDEAVAISPHSQIRVSTNGDGPGGMLLTEAGTSLFRIGSRSDQAFVVVTPYLVATGRGTTFTVTAGPLGDMVQALDGSVEVSTHDGGASETLRAGSVATLSAGDLHQLRIEGDRGKVIRAQPASASAPARGAPSTRAAPLLPLVPMDVLLGDGGARLIRVAAASADLPSPADALFVEIRDAARDGVEPGRPPVDLRREHPQDIGKPGKKDDAEAASGGE